VMEVGSTHPAHPKFVGWERMAKTYHEHNVQLLADLASLRAEVRQFFELAPSGDTILDRDTGEVVGDRNRTPATWAALEEEG
jgi:hypothetical protein